MGEAKRKALYREGMKRALGNDPITAILEVLSYKTMSLDMDARVAIAQDILHNLYQRGWQLTKGKTNV